MVQKRRILQHTETRGPLRSTVSEKSFVENRPKIGIIFCRYSAHWLHNARGILAVLVCCVSLFGSCLSPQHIFVAETNQYTWNAVQPAKVTYENTDTVSQRFVNLLLRYNSDFHYDNLILSVTTITPDGYSWCDTVFVAVPGHKLYNHRFADIEQTYRQEVRFTQPGRYLFRFMPVMPEPNVKGVAAVGVTIDENQTIEK